MACELCKAVEDKYRIFLEDEHSFAIIVREPQLRFHSMVLPKRHVEFLSELTPKEAVSLNRMLEKASEKIESAAGCSVTIMLNRNENKTQPHLHYHISPTGEGVRTLVSALKKVPEYLYPPKEELTKMAEELRR